MQIHLAHGGKRFGPMDLDTLNRAIAAGSVDVERTMAWWEGAGDWRPLRDVPAVRSLASPPAPPVHPMPPPAAPAGDATGGVIPYKNPPALIAYYLGILSLLPVLGIPIGLAALILGIQGLRKRNREPHVKGSVHALIGIVVGGGSMAIQLLIVIAISLRA